MPWRTYSIFFLQLPTPPSRHRIDPAIFLRGPVPDASCSANAFLRPFFGLIISRLIILNFISLDASNNDVWIHRLIQQSKKSRDVDQDPKKALQPVRPTHQPSGALCRLSGRRQKSVNGIPRFWVTHDGAVILDCLYDHMVQWKNKVLRAETCRWSPISLCAAA